MYHDMLKTFREDRGLTEYNHETGKWEKDPMQDKSTLYAPDYEPCKI